MKKAARITGIVLGCVFLIICALPFVGAAVNIADGHIRADRAEKLISDMGGEICDSFVYTGNTSGTGNHTENQLFLLCAQMYLWISKRSLRISAAQMFIPLPGRGGGFICLTLLKKWISPVRTDIILRK